MVKNKKTTYRSAAALGLFIAMVFVLFQPLASRAQFGIPQPTFTTVVASIPTTQQTIWQKVTNTLKAIWNKNGSRAFQTAVRGVTYKLAQDTATFVASGGKGQKPLLFSDPGTFFRESGDQVAGKFLVGLSEGLPLNLCSAADIKSKLAIDIGINQALLPRKNVSYYDTSGGCSLSSIKDNFAAAVKAENFLINVSTTFEPGKSEISHGVRLWDDAKLAQEKFEAAEIIRRTQPADTKALQDVITKNPTTPKELIIEAQNNAQRQATNQTPPRTEDIFIDTFAVFTNTLTQKYLQKLSGGFYPFRNTSGGPDTGDLIGSGASSKALLAAFDVFSPQRAAAIGAGAEIDLFSDMISCPEPQYQSPYHCILGKNLQDAVSKGWTVQQALDKGLFSDISRFPQAHEEQNAVLSVENLRKLRFLRVIPLGWEIAAERLTGSGVNKSFADVVKCFKAAAADTTCQAQGQSLAGLIDPDWVLALPQQYCRAEGFGQIPEDAQSTNRQKWCVDLQSCIKEDNNGNCQAFGYCTRERAAWRLTGESCSQQYATCQVLRRPDGSTVGQGQTAGILGSTVDQAGCTNTNAGCAWFSTAGAGSNWDASNRIYLTSLAPSCRAEDAGSREIIPLEPGTNLIRLGAATEIVPVRQYAFYTLSFDFSGSNDLEAKVAGSGLTNVSFSRGQDKELFLDLLAGTSGRYAATFFNQGGNAVVVSFSQPEASRAQLEEISVTDGQKAQATVAANSGAGTRVLNYSPAATRNNASPATDYKPYQANRRLVFAGARECSPEEASARKYTALGANDSKIAQLSAGDLCPAACVGLNSYLAMPTALETDVEPVIKKFAAQYAKACPAAEAGCEEFTNLTAQTGGAEKRSYFSQVRSCVLDTNPQAATFYTWEGTDTAGFQLKSWQLLKDASGAPCNNFPQNSTANATTAQCAGVSSECALGEANPNCRVFLDEAGREFKRDVSKAVSASSECSAFRRTRDGATWYLLARESKPCASANVGCREYKGNRANLSTRILYSNFESQNHGWVQGSGQSSVISSAAVVAGQKSLKLSGKDSLAVADNLRANLADTFLINFIAKNEQGGRITEISLSAGNPQADFNGDGQVNQLDFTAFTNAFNQSASSAYAQYDIDKNGIVNFNDFLQFTSTYNTTTAPASFALGTAQLSGTWQEYQFGPLPLPAGSAAPVYILSIASAGDVYIDNIELLASPAQFYITDSWAGKQPAACSAYSRCEAYTDDIRNTFYTSRFARLFGADSAYCRAVIDTQNSDSAGSEEFNNDGAGDNAIDNYRVAADKLDYRIIKPENLRPAASSGCTALGVPIDQGNANSGFSGQVYRVIDPDTFKQGSLCRAEGLGCQSFTNESGQAFNFRDPGNKLCVWDENDNRFEKAGGSNEDCPATGYVAQCPAAQSGCTAYKPVDANLTEGAASILFMRQDTVEAQSCADNSTLASGCVKFTENYASSAVLENKLADQKSRTLAVTATRQCAEWLAPTTTAQVNNPATRSLRTVNYSLGRCQALADNGTCRLWASQSSSAYPAAYLDNGRVVAFQADVYAARGAGGKNLFNGGWDYSGYSIPGQYPLELLKEQPDATGIAYPNAPASAIKLSCRSFPEEDSPFSATASDKLNQCESGENCQCTYKKVTTTDGESKYYGPATTEPFPDNIRSAADFIGWQGYCVERDTETLDPNNEPACLAWWPVDVASNSVNIFDNHPAAGFASPGPQYYCLAAKGNKLASPSLVTEKTSRNNYFIRVSDYSQNFTYGQSSGTNVVPLKLTVGRGGLNSVFGWNASGLHSFKVESGSDLLGLREIDIESIILRVKGRQSDDWPANKEEFYLQRSGFAKSTAGAPEAGDRWAAFWCGGKGEEQCDFNDVYKWDKFLPFIHPEGNTECQSESVGKTNLFALRARFADEKGDAGDWKVSGVSHAPGQFLGIEGGLCDSTNDDGWVEFDIIFQLREWCTTVALVSQAGENKAWTGRLNQKSDTSDSANGLYDAVLEKLSLPGVIGLDYKYNQDKAPFGAMVPPPATIHLPVEWDSRLDEEAIDEFDPQAIPKELEPGKQPIYIEENRKQVRAGSPYSCPGSGLCVVPPIEKGQQLAGGNSLQRGVDYLQQLFAKIYQVWSWPANGSSYEVNNSLVPVNNLDLALKPGGWPGECPIIESPGVAGDRNTVGAGDCSQQQSYWGFYAVNNRPIKAVSANNRFLAAGFAPIEANIGQAIALQFYAYNSNGEQLPLRKIEIDWHDGSKTITNGNFKNHRPSCDNASPNYGLTTAACDPNLFAFNHVYTQAGSYIPTVTVWDNWGRFTVARYLSPGGDTGVIKVAGGGAVPQFTALPTGQPVATQQPIAPVEPVAPNPSANFTPIFGDITQLFDGVKPGESATWNVPEAVRFNNQSSIVVYKFSQTTTIRSISGQFDNNDTYRVDYSLDGQNWEEFWTAPLVSGFGLMTRVSSLERGAVTANYIRVYPTGGDGNYSGAEITIVSP